ncbi:hypothetical protein HMPREF1869_00981 [Bacteroidales bacterium KA00251]|nr:hypothetical protein HMPREF1869_00981 [Bacteroidales bacterium KA00251]
MFWENIRPSLFATICSFFRLLSEEKTERQSSIGNTLVGTLFVLSP